MLDVNFNPFPVITTERLLLRKVKKSDVNEILFLRSDNRVMKYLDRVPAKTLYDAYEFIKKINKQIKNNESIIWAITIKGILS